MKQILILLILLLVVISCRAQNTYTFDGNISVTGTTASDVVSEYTAATGVTIDGLLLQDGSVELSISDWIQWGGNTKIYEGATDQIYFDIAGTDELVVTASTLAPLTTNGLNLGSPTLWWNDNYFTTAYIGSSGAYLDYSGSDLRLTDPTAGTVTLSSLIVATGTQDQIPQMNAGGTGFDYSANLTFNGTTLDVNSTITTDNINEHTTDAGVTIESLVLEDNIILFNEVTAPGAPAANDGLLYMNVSDEKIYFQNSSTTYDLTGGGVTSTGTIAQYDLAWWNDAGNTLTASTGEFTVVDDANDTYIKIEDAAAGDEVGLMFSSNGTNDHWVGVQTDDDDGMQVYADGELILNGTSGVTISGGISEDSEEAYMVTIDNSTGVLSKRVVSTSNEITDNPQTISYTLVAADRGKLVSLNNASGVNLTVPPNSSVDFPVHTQITILQKGAGQVTIVEGSGVTINSADDNLKLRVQFSSATLWQESDNVWYLWGDLEY